METHRIEYNHVCKDSPYDPRLFYLSVEEAIKVFLKKERGINGYEFHYNEGHPLTIGNLREIAGYVDDVWSNREIYYFTEDKK